MSLLCFSMKTGPVMQLREISVTGAPDHVCERLFGQYINVNDTIQMCAGDLAENRKDACQVKYR